MAEQALTQMAKQAIDLATEKACQSIGQQIDSGVVKAKAKELIDYATQIRSEYYSTADSINNLNVSSEQQMLSFSKKYITTEQQYKELMQRVFEFQNVANEFIGQKVFMTFVAISPISGKVTLYNVKNSVEDLSIGKASSKRGGGITGRYSSLAKMKAANAKELIASGYDKSSLDSTFQEVWQRFRISKAHLTLKGAAFILWYLGEWRGRWISGAGPLGEAYVAFFVNRQTFKEEIEKNVETFMTNSNYGAVNADSESGFLKGDVVKDGIQFGVKVRGAAALQPNEIIKYAKEIQDVTDVKRFLYNVKNELANNKSQNMVKDLSKFLQGDCEELLNSLEDIKEQIEKKIGIFTVKIN